MANEIKVIHWSYRTVPESLGADRKYKSTGNLSKISNVTYLFLLNIVVFIMPGIFKLKYILNEYCIFQ